MTKTGWIVLIVLIILAGGAFWWWSSQSQTPPVDQGASSPATQDTGQPSSANSTGASADVNANTGTLSGTVNTSAGTPMSATVTYDGISFSPASVTIAKGGTVTFTDTAGASMWVASGQHPTHTGYDSTSASVHCATGYTGPAPFDQCGTGASFSFTFNKVGTWGYHDHRNVGAFGSVTVAAQ